MLLPRIHLQSSITPINLKLTVGVYHIDICRAPANQSLAETVVVTGSFSFNNDSVASGSLLEDGNRFSISSTGAGGAFTFTPTTTIAANKYFVRTVGNINVTIT